MPDGVPLPALPGGGGVASRSPDPPECFCLLTRIGIAPYATEVIVKMTRGSYG
jgi:hypothetical protein